MKQKREIKLKSLVRRLNSFWDIFLPEKNLVSIVWKGFGLINPVLVHFEGVAIEIVLFWVAH